MPQDDTMKAFTLVKTTGDFKPGPDCWHPTKLVDLASESPSRSRR
jgi:hypothetical protein